ncbi:unnamed protein product [Amoebophrya sp. A120]|nr:unnamed protein product [Amoebophrya sp. A120]|eukprot:GSA120T00008825001.1
MSKAGDGTGARESQALRAPAAPDWGRPCYCGRPAISFAWMKQRAKPLLAGGRGHSSCPLPGSLGAFLGGNRVPTGAPPPRSYLINPTKHVLAPGGGEIERTEPPAAARN